MMNRSLYICHEGADPTARGTLITWRSGIFPGNYCFTYWGEVTTQRGKKVREHRAGAATVRAANAQYGNTPDVLTVLPGRPFTHLMFTITAITARTSR